MDKKYKFVYELKGQERSCFITSQNALSAINNFRHNIGNLKKNKILYFQQYDVWGNPIGEKIIPESRKEELNDSKLLS